MRPSRSRFRRAIGGLATAVLLACPGTGVAGIVELDSTSRVISYDSRLVDDPGARDKVDLKIVRSGYAYVKHEGAVMAPPVEYPNYPPATLAGCRFLIGFARCSGDLQGGEMLLHGGNDVGRLFGNTGGSIYGGTGKDVLRGGTGDDRLHGDDDGTFNELTEEPFADEYFGGDGSDTVVTVGSPGPVTVTLDDQANDGVAGEGDNVHSDVENVTAGGEEGTILVGNDQPNHLGGGRETFGLGGPDVLNGTNTRDTLDGGSGADTVSGRAGDDLVRANDGEGDVIDCGAGVDTVEADALDQLQNCENVRP